MKEIRFSPLVIGAMRFGTWGANLTSKELEYLIDQCLEIGLRDFDHADIYGGYTTERQFGEVIRRRPDLKEKIQITTKCGIKMMCEERPKHQLKSYDSGSAHILMSVDQSLSNLGVDHLDLLLLHRPDYLMDPYDIADAFEELSALGKVNHFGVSNFSTAQFDLLYDQFPLVTNQVELSPMQTTALKYGTIEQCFRLGLRPMIWSPFGGGAVFSKSDDPTVIRVQNTLRLLSIEYEATTDQILLSWILKHPAGLVPIIGTSKFERIEAALQATEIELTKEDWYSILEAGLGQEVA